MRYQLPKSHRDEQLWILLHKGEGVADEAGAPGLDGVPGRNEPVGIRQGHGEETSAAGGFTAGGIIGDWGTIKLASFCMFLQTLSNFANFWRARSRLYRNQMLQ